MTGNAKERIAEWARGMFRDMHLPREGWRLAYPEFLADLAEVLDFPSVPALLGAPPEGTLSLPGLEPPFRGPVITVKLGEVLDFPSVPVVLLGRDSRAEVERERFGAPSPPPLPPELEAACADLMARGLSDTQAAEARRILAADRAASEAVTVSAPPPLDLFEEPDGPCPHARTERTYPNNRFWVTCLDCGDVVSEITGKVRD